MSVKHAVLALVIERPGYGYELIQRLEERIGGWQPSKAAVYPALRALHREQLIRERETTGPAAPAHKGVTWYEATDKGRAHRDDWMLAALQPAPLRDELGVRLAFATVEELPSLVELTRELEEACLARVEELVPAGDLDELVDPEADWKLVSQVWLRRTEVAHLTLTVEALQDARAAMKQTIRCHGRRGVGVDECAG